MEFKEKILQKLWSYEEQLGIIEYGDTIEHLYEMATNLADYNNGDEVGEADFDDWLRQDFWDIADVSVVTWNEYCDDNYYYDMVLYSNDIDIINDHYETPFDAVKAVYYGEYEPCSDYIRFDDNDYLQSEDGFEDMADDDFIDWCIERGGSGNGEISFLCDNRDVIIKKANEIINWGQDD